MQNKSTTSSNNTADLIFARINSSTRKKTSSRYTYVIGNNGTGKSRILGALAERFKNSKSERIVACVASTIHDRFTYGEHNFVRYMGARSSGNAVFLMAIDRQLAKFILQALQIDRRLFRHLSDAVNMTLSFSIEEKSIDMIQSSSEKKTRNSSRITKKAMGSGLLSSRSLAMLRRIASGSGRFEDLTPAQISRLLNYLELNLDFKVKIKFGENEWIDFGALSTGEQNRLLLFAKIISVLQEGTIYLIDEPEISMHLHWQMDFHKTLDKLISMLERSHVVIATHSPIIISEAVKLDPESRGNIVAVLRRENDSNNDDQPINMQPGIGQVSCKMHSFSEVASHEQLVLKYFHTSPYQAREVSVEIADTVLGFMEGDKHKTEAVKSLRELLNVVGLTSEAEQQIKSALDLVEKDIAASIKLKDAT